jgi:hypothetical protein
MANLQNTYRQKHPKNKDDKDNEPTLSNSNDDTTHQAYSAYAVGAQLDTQLKPKPTSKHIQDGGKSVKRDFLARRRRNLKEDANTSADSDTLDDEPSNLEITTVDLTSPNASRPVSSPSNQNQVMTTDNYQLATPQPRPVPAKKNYQQKSTPSRPVPANRTVRGQQPKWITQNQVRVKYQSLHPNLNMPAMAAAHSPVLQQKLEQLKASNVIKQFHPTPQGFKIVLAKNATMHVNPKVNEMTFHQLNKENTKRYLHIAKELGVESLEVSEANSQQQSQLYKEGQQKGIKMEGIALDIAKKFAKDIAKHYVAHKLIPKI